MLRGVSFPRVPRATLNAKKMTINTVEGHKFQVSHINSSQHKTSFHVKTEQKAAHVTINSTPQAFRFCVQPTKTTNLKNENSKLVFFVNRRHNSDNKEETTQENKNTQQDRNNPLSIGYHANLPADQHSPQHMFDPIPKALMMPSLWLFLVAIILIKELLSRQSEGIADDLIVLLHRYEIAKEEGNEESKQKAEAELVQFLNMSSLLFLMGNPKLKSPELLQALCDFLLGNHPAHVTETVLQVFNAVAHCSRAAFPQAELPLYAFASKFSNTEILKDTTVVSSLSQVLDTLVVDGYDINKLAASSQLVKLVDVVMAHHPDAAIATRASHILRAFAQNPSTAPAVQNSVPTLIHIIKRQDNNESVIYAKEAIQGLVAASNSNPDMKAVVESQLHSGTVSQEFVNEVLKFERPVTFSKLPKIGTELSLAVAIAVIWGYLRWNRTLRKRGVSPQDINKIVRYRTALTAGTTAVAVGASILEDNVIAHHSEVASDVVAFIGWPLFLAVTPFIIVPSFLSAIVSSHAFDKICDEHRR